MRIQGVTGDLPAVAQLMVETPPKVEAPPTAPPPAVTAAAAAGETGGDHTSSDHRRPPQHLAAFDPPLIAQRAVLGLPVGMMVVEHAKAAGISYLAAWEAVDRAMPIKPQPDPTT